MCNCAKYYIQSYQYQTYFVQRILSTSNGELIPLLYPISMFPPSIGYKMIELCGSITNFLPSFLVTANNSTYVFAPIFNHIQSNMTNPDVITNINPKCITSSYTMLTNLTLHNTNTWLILN